ncbi:MAG: glycosyltransferase family protein [Methanomicrobiaceae archaeon]|nr:glycosyltransferase family protein [Methanomicrobiaceae archaeon]
MILGIIQARSGSSRLPAKVLKVVEGKPLLQHMLERVQRSKMVDSFVVATTILKDDDSIARLCDELGVDCFRGSEDDVLDRYYQCAVSSVPQPDYIVRLTADCPLHDPEVIDFVVNRFLAVGADYMTNSFPPVFEDGFDTEIFSFNALKYAWENAKRKSDREHVTPFIHKMAFPDEETPFKIYTEKSNERYHYKLSVDTPKDFEIVREIFSELYPENSGFGMSDVIDLLERKPELLNINEESRVNEGYYKSLSEDGLIKNEED